MGNDIKFDREGGPGLGKQSQLSHILRSLFFTVIYAFAVVVFSSHSLVAADTADTVDTGGSAVGSTVESVAVVNSVSVKKRPESPVTEILRARTAHVAMIPFSQRGLKLNLDQAYAIQGKVHQALLAQGAVLAGYKVAFTSPAAQQKWQVSAPCIGPLYWSGVAADGIVMEVQDFVLFTIEAEIGFVLKSAITVVPERAEDLAGAVASVHLAFDIPDLRFDLSNGLPTAMDLLADGMAGRSWTLGRGIAPERFDPQHEVKLFRNDELVTSAPATAALGSPWNVLAWLAEQQIQRNQPLQAGQLVLTGTLGKMYIPKSAGAAAGCYRAEAKGLGSIEVIVK